MTFDVRMVDSNISCNVGLQQTDVFNVSVRDTTQNVADMESTIAPCNVQMQESTSTLDARLEDIQIVTISDVPFYTGAYEVDPTFETQTLATAMKYLAEDVTVNAIEVDTVSNLQGGNTVYIGGMF